MNEQPLRNAPHRVRSAPTRLPNKFTLRLRNAVRIWADSRRARKYDDSIFIHIPKNGGTSVYTMLHSAGLVKLNTLRSVQLFNANKGRVTFGHMAISSLIELGLVSPDYVKNAFKFALVRDPYARASSLYRIYLKIAVNWHREPSFREFLQMVASGLYDRIGPYDNRGMSPCNPQSAWLRDTPPDKIYRVENLPQFAADISERWAIPKPDLVHMNWTSRDGAMDLSRDEKALIQEIYREDFESLGYEK